MNYKSEERVNAADAQVMGIVNRAQIERTQRQERAHRDEMAQWIGRLAQKAAIRAVGYTLGAVFAAGYLWSLFYGSPWAAFWLILLAGGAVAAAEIVWRDKG